MKSIKMWLTSMSARSRLNLSYFISLHKNFIKSALKTTVKACIHCIMFYFYFSMNVFWVEAQVSDPGGDDLSSGGGSDLGAAQNSLEVWAFTWWKGESLEMNGLDAAQGFESGRNICTSSWKIAWEMTPWRPINHVTGWSESVFESGEPRTIT